VSSGLQLGSQATVADQHGIVGHGEHHGATLRPLGPRLLSVR
jgi:hypothetical protein